MKQKTIQGEEHVLVLLKVLQKDEFERPRSCEIVYDDMRVKLEGGEEFITAWIPLHLTTAVTKGEA